VHLNGTPVESWCAVLAVEMLNTFVIREGNIFSHGNQKKTAKAETGTLADHSNLSDYL